MSYFSSLKCLHDTFHMVPLCTEYKKVTIMEYLALWLVEIIEMSSIEMSFIKKSFGSWRAWNSKKMICIKIHKHNADTILTNVTFNVLWTTKTT